MPSSPPRATAQETERSLPSRQTSARSLQFRYRPALPFSFVGKLGNPGYLPSRVGNVTSCQNRNLLQPLFSMIYLMDIQKTSLKQIGERYRLKTLEFNEYPENSDYLKEFLKMDKYLKGVQDFQKLQEMI